MSKAKKNESNRKAAKRSTKKPAVKPETNGTCFVMMPFKEPFGVYYDTIFKPAIIEANLEPIRTWKSACKVDPHRRVNGSHLGQ